MIHAVEEKLRPEALETLQAERLRATVRRACERVPFHRTSLDATGVDPADIRGISDLGHLPFTHTSGLRRHYPFGLHQVAERLGLTVVPASGGATARQARLILNFGADGIAWRCSGMKDSRPTISSASTAYATSTFAGGGAAGDLLGGRAGR